MFKKLTRKFTKDYEEVPLFYVTFDLNRYLKDGEKGSCSLSLHPALRGDEFLEEHLIELVDYIRKNYDMKELVE